jgi:CubicO group peptidase (beta-lactamase class C family)
MSASRPIDTPIQGSVEPGFEPVRIEFARNFSDRKELGAAFAVYHRGRKVVDLWGGHRDSKHETQWQADTLTTVFSSTKGIASLVMALAHSRGLFEWDAPVAEYWPEFAQAGKEQISVRQLLAHQAGLSAIDTPLDVAILGDLDRLAVILAKQPPAWTPGTRHGYHAISLGWYQSELLRRVDPARRSLGCYLREELAEPLDLDIHIGLPASIPDERIGWTSSMPLLSILLQLGKRNTVPWRMVLEMLKRKSLTGRSFGNPRLRNVGDFNRDPLIRSVEIPSVNGFADARSIAKLYGVFANGGVEIGLRKQTLDDLMADPVLPSEGLGDLVLHTDTVFSLGFMKPHDAFDFASSGRAFGTPGAGGSFCFADPDARLGMAYIMNRMGGYLVDDPREKALRDAVYRSVAKLGPGG